jgi:Spy/CpxP family protein refolding chaperone
MRRIQYIFTAIVLSLSLAAFAQSTPDTQSGQGEHQGRGHGPMSVDAQLDHMSQALNLTDDQKAKIKPILEEQSKKMHDLMQDSSVSQEDRRAKFQEIHEDTMSKVRPLLNDDQQKKMDAMMKERRGEGHGRRGEQPHDQSNPQ